MFPCLCSCEIRGPVEACTHGGVGKTDGADGREGFDEPPARGSKYVHIIILSDAFPASFRMTA